MVRCPLPQHDHIYPLLGFEKKCQPPLYYQEKKMLLLILWKHPSHFTLGNKSPKMKLVGMPADLVAEVRVSWCIHGQTTASWRFALHCVSGGSGFLYL